MKLENVQYAPHLLTRRRLVGFFLLSVAVPYIWKRLFRYLSSVQWTARGRLLADDTRASDNTLHERQLLTVMKKIETVMATCQFVNLLVFLRRGTYPSLAERCLGMKLVRSHSKRTTTLLVIGAVLVFAYKVLSCMCCRKASLRRQLHG